MTAEQSEQTISIEQFLNGAKIGKTAADIITKRQVSIEELIQFDDNDLQSFTNELQLDILSKNRFINSITKLKKQKNKNNMPKRRIFLSQPESNAISKLYQQYNKTSELLLSIQTSIEQLNKYAPITNNQIENTINSIINQLKSQKNKLLKDIDNIMDDKFNILQKQMTATQNHLNNIVDAKSKYESYNKQTMRPTQQKQVISKMISDILNNDISTTMLTSPKMQFNVDNYIKQLQTLYLSTVINDCDVPKIMNLSLRKVYYDSIAMEFSLNNEEYISESNPILEFAVEYAILPKEYSKNKYNSESDESTENDISDDNKKNELDLKINEIDINSLKWKRNDEKIKYHKKHNEYKIGKIYKFKICDVKSNRVYLIRICARNSSGFGAYSKIISVATKKHGRQFEIKRGTFSGSAGYSCTGKVDAVCFTCNKNIMLFGVGILDCKGTVNVELKVFKGENNNQGKYIGISSRKSFTRPCASKAVIRLNLKKPVKIKKNVKYTIQIDQTNSGGSSYYINGISTVTVGKVTVYFSKAFQSENGSDALNSGPFPVLYCSM